MAVAIDASSTGNRGQASLDFTVRARPTVQAISPSTGGTAGGTDVVITGSGFLPGSQAILEGVPLFPDGGIVIDEQTLSAHVPAHKEGSAAITVRTPLGDAIGASSSPTCRHPFSKPSHRTPARLRAARR